MQAYGFPHTVHAHCRLSDASNARNSGTPLSWVIRHRVHEECRFSSRSAWPCDRHRVNLQVCRHSLNEALPHVDHQSNGQTGENLQGSGSKVSEQQLCGTTSKEHGHDHGHSHGYLSFPFLPQQSAALCLQDIRFQKLSHVLPSSGTTPLPLSQKALQELLGHHAMHKDSLPAMPTTYLLV